MLLTGLQIRAARALAEWDRDDLVEHTGLSRMAIQNIETNPKIRSKPETFEKITAAFNRIGIEFTPNEGVRRRSMEIEIFEGSDRFDDFMSFMYQYLSKHGGEVCTYVTDERYLQRSRRNISEHRATMMALVKEGKVKGRTIASAGEMKQGWSELRKQKVESDMPQVSFIAFGDNLALISFDRNPSPYVILHKDCPFAAAYKASFNITWEKAEII